VAEEVLSIKYLEHPQVDNLGLRAEVHYPNLSFEVMDIDFGCILNDTEVIRYIMITNCSPLVVKFRWFFLVDEEENQIRYATSRHVTPRPFLPLSLSPSPTISRRPVDLFCSLSSFVAFLGVNCALCTSLS
jgi:hypothetical protein